MNLSVIVLLLQLLLLSCSLQKTNSSGVVLARLYYYDTSQNRYVHNELYWPDVKIYYKDSSIIEQIRYLHLEDNLGLSKRKVEVDHYTFINLSKRMFYDYTTFSDTAAMIKKYTQPDSVNVLGGWNFYAYHDTPASEPPVPISDTTIDGTIFKRYRFTNSHKKDLIELKDIVVGYLDCKKKGTMFQIDKRFSEKRGCPLVRTDNFFDGPPGPFSKTSARMEFLSDSLTPEEAKVFDVWEKNARQNPVSPIIFH